MQSQDRTGQPGLLKKMPERVNQSDENFELSSTNNNSRMRRDLAEEAAYTAYDALEHRKTFQKQQKAYNAVREQYEEEAYSSETQSVHQSSRETESDQPESRQPVGADESESIRSQWKSPAIYEVESRSIGLAYDTAESPKLEKNSRELKVNEKLQQKLDSRRKEIQKGYTQFSAGNFSTKEKIRLRYFGPLDLTKESEMHIGRLKHTSRITREKMTKEDYEVLLDRRSRRNFSRRAKGRLLFHGIKTLVDEKTLHEDEMAGSMKRSIRRTARVAMTATRRNIRTIKSQNNIYSRLDQAEKREQVLLDKRERLLSDAKKKAQKNQLREAKSREQKKRLKKEMVQIRIREEGHFFHRTRQNMLVKRRAQKEQRRSMKRILSTVFSLAGIIIFVLVILIILFLLLVALFTGGSDYYASAVTQNDYATITGATEYFRKLETDLDEYLNADREKLEKELEAEYGPDIYEYVYCLADFGFSANTLIAYLSAVYGSFTLENVKEELHSVFADMYILTIEVKEEDREVTQYNPDTDTYENVTELKKICYIILEKKELEDVVEARMTPEQMEQYRNYRLSTGGQQVYGPVMKEDWTNLISSNFGERIHPITKERKVHNGVDIAVPIGTPLYSAVDGTVILAEYSESAGNWVKVQTETGWTVIFMHMDSLIVSAGYEVNRGDHLGYSGNTGRSTGPHLHLEVRNQENMPINPIFIIPQTCARGGE